jgi:RHS repeat-associated protein
LKLTAGGVNYGKLTAEQQKALDTYVKSLGVPPGPPTQHGIYATPEFTGDPYPSEVIKPVEENQEPPEGWPRNPVFNAPGDVPGPPVQFGPPVEPETVKSGEGFTGIGLPENDIFYFHPDHLGSTSYITARNGSISQHVEYIAFGEVLFEEHSSSFSSPYLFNGKELDRETNLSYYGARYLDMKTSLWLSVDPLALYNPIFEDEFYFDGDHNDGIYNGKNLNTYAYCYQNPINLIDPNGKQVNWQKVWNRTTGGVQMVGGVVESVLGGVGGIVTAETGVGAVVGYAILINGIDNTVTGAKQMWTGESESTLLHKGVSEGSKALGASDQTAENIATGADIATIAIGSGNALKNTKVLKSSGGKINGVSKGSKSGYGAQKRFDIHPLKHPSKATNKLTIPKIFKDKKIPIPHYHKGKGNNLRIHRPWEVDVNGKRIW